MSVYQRRATLFLDLLGFRNLVRNGRESDIIDALNVSAHSQIQYKDAAMSDFDFRVTAFSDCIVSSVRLLARNNFMPAAFLASYGGRLALEMLTRGILVRGALTVGNLYHVEQAVFGPALIEAYELESQFAQYPRIVVPRKVYGNLNISLSITMGVEWFIEHPPCREDFDGMFHLDIFGPFYIDSRPRTLTLKNSRSIEDLGGVTTRLVRKLCKPKYKDHRISTKYEWLRYYLEDCGNRFGWKVGGRPRNAIFFRARKQKEGKVETELQKPTVNEAEI
ncbi:hypothetical protein [Bradyrhizobium sp. SZCCHNRI20481]|uniref:hypothetical protein n=1 Tax=Bradyrhizobium sp. SZCCHNRI20481 TaxID=3057286 RepID=UPI002916BAD2|nr:hypothetical protein [Bradyrhizobium sp. SZCCHNRI20481]